MNMNKVHDSMTSVKPTNDSRLIVVSNRLPVTVEEKDGELQYNPSSGGLATGLGSLQQSEQMLWVGWPGSVTKRQQRSVTDYLSLHHGCTPVFLSERLIEKYYDGFSNRTVWPLFHSFQSFARYSASEWVAYQEANQRFFAVLRDLIRPGDRVWIHDYQLLLLPEFLRHEFPNLAIGFFLHIPFPSFDVLRLMPQHRAILQSLLACDLVGFHTHDYARAFLGGVHRALGLDDRFGQITFGDRTIETIVHPMGIHFEKFSNAAARLEGKTVDLDLQRTIGDSKAVFSVSRLDYTKGIPQALEGFDLLLRRRPDLHRKIVFILCVVPSREKVDRYAVLKREIDESVGRINANYGGVDWTPIRYLYRSLEFEELVLLYKNCHIGLVSPLRDGMNLVAKEYVASRSDETGVLILSEMAGAAKELLEALLINPSSKEEISQALETAFDMPEEEQRLRMKALRERLTESPIQNWGDDFVRRLDQCATDSRRLASRVLTPPRRLNIIEQALRAKKRLFILDYDGTLMPIMNNPKHVYPDEPLKDLLASLTKQNNDEVLVISGRSHFDLDQWLSDLPISLVAEHGAWARRKSEKEWHNLFDAASITWKAEVHRALKIFVEAIPGSWVEEKEYSLVWHYRRADPESADHAARDLVFHLLSAIGELPVRVVPGHRSIEIRSFHVGKGLYTRKELPLADYDFILAAGDDITDEDLFAALPVTATTIKIGIGYSRAQHRLRDHAELRSFLSELSQALLSKA